MVILLSTYPPRKDGIATFSQDLLESLTLITSKNLKIRVAVINPSNYEKLKYSSVIRWQINPDSITDYKNVAKSINRDADVTSVIIQHEYGIFGGTYGSHILAFLKVCRKPILVTLHTVLPNPPPELKIIQDEIVDRADKIVVLTGKSKDILVSTYPNIAQKVFVVPHGIHPAPFCLPKDCKKALKLSRRMVFTTFGLLSRGKGIEYVLQSLPPVVKKYPRLLYLILGETHPNIRQIEGESYRQELTALVKKLHLSHNVRFYNQFLTLNDILTFLQATDVYVSTSINPNQAVSGTLSYALGSGRATVSTSFSQSNDLVTPDVGLLVQPQNPNSFTEAFLSALSDSESLKNMHLNAFIKTRNMIWPNVAYDYLSLFNHHTSFVHLLPPVKLNYLRHFTSSFGLYQFGHYQKPNKRYGYTLDDNARGLVLVNLLLCHGVGDPKILNRLARIYIDFIKFCQIEDGTFKNYVDIHQRFVNNIDEDLDSTQARALWALAYTMDTALLPPELLDEAKEIWQKATIIPPISDHPHALAILIRAYYYQQDKAMVTRLADRLVSHYRKVAHENWSWFEDNLSYDNGSFPEVLFLAYQLTGKKIYQKVAVASLDFLIKTCFWGGVYVPIGQKGWYFKNATRQIFDQQPEDTFGMVMALTQGFKTTQNLEYKELAFRAFSWFIGNNLMGAPLYNPKNGGCFDALTPKGPNRNQGAESLLSYLISRLLIEELL